VAVLGVLSCEILELEFAHLLRSDPEVSRITVVNDERSTRLTDALELGEANELRRIPRLNEFSPSSTDGLEVLIRVLELGLHIWPMKLQEALLEAAHETAPHVDALLLGYGLCGNALQKPQELLSGLGVPAFIPMDEDHPVDDCVGLLIGGRERYCAELCKVAGTFFITPGWSYHWRRMFDQEFGGMSLDLAKRMFEHYERTLLISNPIMTEDRMAGYVGEFNEMFGFRSECCDGTLDILTDTWKAAKYALDFQTGTTEDGLKGTSRDLFIDDSWPAQLAQERS
jgi:hypothetical protein